MSNTFFFFLHSYHRYPLFEAGGFSLRLQYRQVGDLNSVVLFFFLFFCLLLSWFTLNDSLARTSCEMSCTYFLRYILVAEVTNSLSLYHFP